MAAKEGRRIAAAKEKEARPAETMTTTGMMGRATAAEKEKEARPAEMTTTTGMPGRGTAAAKGKEVLAEMTTTMGTTGRATAAKEKEVPVEMEAGRMAKERVTTEVSPSLKVLASISMTANQREERSATTTARTTLNAAKENQEVARRAVREAVSLQNAMQPTVMNDTPSMQLTGQSCP